MDRDIKNIVMDKGYVQNTIFELLSRLGIGYEKLEHSPIITMKEGSEIAYKLGSTSCKNLFLCNKRQEYFIPKMHPTCETLILCCVNCVLHPAPLLKATYRLS